jgi:hypothetical protein
MADIAWASLHRICSYAGLSCTSGEVEVDISYAPRPEYGLIVPLLAHVDGGVTARGGAEWLVLTSPLNFDLERGTARGHVSLEAGQTVHLALHRSTLEQTPAHIWSEQELCRESGCDYRGLAIVVRPAPEL